MAQAIAFFTDVMGCRAAMTFGPFSDDKDTFMQDVLAVDRHAVIEQITMVRCGAGSNIELFKYTAPDQKDMTPGNSDIGGMHIALHVDDVQAAKDYLDAKHVRTLKGPFPSGRGRPSARRSFISWRPGDCSSKRSAIPKGWAMRRPPAPYCGSRRNPRNRRVTFGPMLESIGVPRYARDGRTVERCETFYSAARSLSRPKGKGRST